MKPTSKYKYLVHSEKDLKWGVVVDTVGHQLIDSNYTSYPLKAGHPSSFYFDINKGRILKSYQLVYIASGRGKFYGHDKVCHEIGPGNIILLRPNSWHTYMPEKDSGWHEYWIGFYGHDIDARIKNNIFGLDCEIFDIGVNMEIVSLFEKAIEIADKELSAYQQYLAGIAVHLLGFVIYNNSNKRFTEIDTISQIDMARKIIREEIYNAISPAEVAQRVNMSYSWFRKIFREYTHISPAQYMQQLRLEEACNLLANTPMSIKEIAFRLNYGDASYFSNIFHRKLKITPIDYRRKFGSKELLKETEE